MMLKATASQAHYAPKTSAAGCSAPGQIGVMVALRPNAPWEPPGADSQLFALKPSTPFTEPYRLSAVRRTHAHQGTLRLHIGATGYEEGQDIVSRSSHSCTRAPTVRKRSWRVSMVAEAHWVVLNTSRRHVSRRT